MCQKFPTSLNTPPTSPALVNFDDRLDCWGSFSSQDYVCLTCCALAIRCALARDDYAETQKAQDLAVQGSPFLRHDCQ
ncbi:MAG: hypothetical protein LBO05_11520 [Deltaproteobacteria bacterium]|jgi:hypothetical protein|nr:hypothetical protein [Deltaproteobacteria bacterium]